MAKHRRKLRIYTYRGKELEEMKQMQEENLWELFPARIRRKIKSMGGFRGKYRKFLEKIKKAKKNCKAGCKPDTVKTHLRNCVIMPDMIGGMIACYNGKEYKEFEVKFDMIGRYVGEYSITY